MRATIKMIAEQAGVSIGTVDRVLHDRPYVKEEVRQRVLQVMEALEYRPNHVASALAKSATPRRFTVIQPEWDPYVREEMAEGVRRFCEERRDYNVAVEVWYYPPDDTAACLRLMEQAEADGTQGIALCATDCPEICEKVEHLQEQKIPVVTFNSDLADSVRLCYVGEDAHRAGRIAGEIAAKFLRAGEHFLVVYAGPAYTGHKARAEGFLERMKECGFREGDWRIAASHNDYEQTFRAVKQALAEDPGLTYVYMANLSVPACVEAIREAGRNGQVRVLSHDSGPDICRYLKEGRVDFTIGQDLRFQTHQALAILYRLTAEHQRPKQTFYYSESPIFNAETI